jgi:lipopolysaccharide/colanic/teichoic acid biosynthesis glycosyltransferase
VTSKRAVDVILAAGGFVLLAPLLTAIGVVIRLTSPGRALYRQARVGLGGRVFWLLKFRTMRQDAEATTGPVWARVDDPRRTAFGAFLRRWSLDEVPQLWNVLRGEMSLVGPRPERPHFVAEFRDAIAGYDERHRVPVGLTGWAQVNGWRGDTSIEHRTTFDLYYVRRRSFGFDAKILLATLWRVRRHAA